jgi:hypothetical protein
MGDSMATLQVGFRRAALTQAPKGSKTRDYFDMARLQRRNTEFNWHREGFGAEPPTGCVQFQEFMQRQQRSRKIKSL